MSSIPLPPSTPGIKPLLMHPNRLEIVQDSCLYDKHEVVPENNPSTKHKFNSCLIIGDSMTIGLTVPDSVVISKGGIHPCEVLKLLHDSPDLLHPDDYERICSVTLVVGTNPLNVTSPGKGILLLDIVL